VTSRSRRQMRHKRFLTSLALQTNVFHLLLTVVVDELKCSFVVWLFNIAQYSFEKSSCWTTCRQTIVKNDFYSSDTVAINLTPYKICIGYRKATNGVIKKCRSNIKRKVCLKNCYCDVLSLLCMYFLTWFLEKYKYSSEQKRLT
jgi:hypothetical protein